MSGAPHSQEKTEVDRKRKTSPTFLEFDGAGAEGGGGARVVSKLLRENPPEEGASTLKGDISQFLNEVRKATGDAPTVLESAQGRTGTAPLVEINLAIDDLVEVKDIPEIAAKAPHTRDGILLPTERTDAYMDETKFHQKQSLTKMVLALLGKDDNGDSEDSDSSSSSSSSKSNGDKMEDSRPEGQDNAQG